MFMIWGGLFITVIDYLCLINMVEHNKDCFHQPIFPFLKTIFNYAYVFKGAREYAHECR